jgi:hypothetical protein
VSGIDELRELNRILAGLLGNPHPELFTWREMLSETLLKMADFSGHGMISEIVKANQQRERRSEVVSDQIKSHGLFLAESNRAGG